MVRLLDRMGARYGRLPSELIDLSPEDLTLNAIALMQHDTDAANGLFTVGDTVPVLMTEAPRG